MHKLLGSTAALLLGGLLSAGAVNVASAQSVVLKYGELNPDSHPMTVVARAFAKLVKEKSNGDIVVDVYPSSQLGDERTELQGLQMGAIDMFRANAVSLGDFGSKKSNLFSLPYLFRDRNHLWNVLHGEIGQDILSDVQASGSMMVGVAFMEEGQRNFFFRDAPVSDMEGIKGKKIRVPQTQILIDTVKAFGAAPTPISYSELYSALQTGVVDGAENPPTGYLANNFYEVAPYYMVDGHTYSPSIMVMSEISWNKLSADQQAIIAAAARETEDFNKSLAEEADAKAYEELKAKGAQIITVTDLPEWPKAVGSVYEKYGSDFTDIIQAILAVK
ncbi:tripartite ATP-independent transporter solute receptor, DctP family [Cohaesibacter sp. ES.047]|uniref:TRAP transporter substrate-binding protein n=1 Tax=Cohaesibacter sp. ES.047 TaxID=1798205 RepID=UPI000BB7D18B|nr:TRAP transporter substrate-binding protein [Cohaesibacter sp. ES.047]SNY90261.1 tripartite ATP-independent transporter solute receptor, DctP family [Cohaesibacter sp. ES.047]